MSTSGLEGGIDPGLANLTMMQTLNLKGNNFVGPIPAGLLEKVNKGSLSLSYDGESTDGPASSCDGNICKNKKDNKIIVPVISAVASFCVILAALTAIWVIIKQKARGTGLEIRKQQYTYSEVQNITDNFDVVIGKGGFGTVYHGYTGNTPVAVKMLSKSSLQGDKEFQAESKAFPTEGGTHISTAVAGTPGYLDPEYYTTNRLTEKSDVYSFGVVLLVLVTGQPTITRYANDNIHICQLVNLKLAEGDINNIVDPRLLGKFDINSSWKAVELAMACVARTPSRRPTMNEVVMELNDCLVTERARQEIKPKKLTGLMSLNMESTNDPNPI
ncbi:putative leucine-rich repeat receptor-like protein kinase [Tanacetum coccineum]